MKRDLAIAYRTMATVVYSAMSTSDITALRASIEYLIKCMQADGIFVRFPKVDHGRKTSKASVKLDIKCDPSSYGVYEEISTMIVVSAFFLV